MAYLDDLSLFAGDNELMGGGDSLDDPGNAWLQRTAQIESGNGRDRLNPLSGARGLYQFLPTTWDGVLKNYPDLGLTPADINSDEAQALAAKAMLQREVIPGLRKALGRDPTPQEIYTAWGLGTPDARKLFNAVKENPNALAPPLFRPKVSEWNKNIFFHDKEGTQPRTVSEVAQAYANLWSGAKEPKGPPMPTQQPPAPDDYDPDAGLARMAQMGQRVGQMQQPGPMPQQRTVGLDALSPYMQLAAQLSPQRRQGDWSDALLSAGIGMMQTNRPDFFGGLGQGLAAAQGTMQQQERQRFEDAQAQSKLGLNLYSAFQKDETPVSLAKGAMLVGKDGRMIANNPDVEPPKTREVKIGDRLVTQEWNGAMWKNVGEAPRSEMKPGETEQLIRLAGIDPNSQEGRDMAKRLLEKKAKDENGGQFPGTGIDASTFNHLVNYNQKIRSGQPTTPQEDMAYSIAYQHASRPTRWTTPDGAMYEAPGIDVSGFVPPKVATQVAPAPGAAAAPSSAVPGARPIVPMAPAGGASPSSSAPSPSGSGSQPGARQIMPPDEKPVAGDSAGRFALVPEARNALEQAQKAYFPDGKTFDRTLAGVAYMNVPNSKGAEIYNAVSRAIANRLRIESGAAAPPAEVTAMTKRYLPTPWDSDALARQKLDGLKQYFDAFATSATQGAGPAIRGGGTPAGASPTPAARPQSSVDFPAPAAIARMSLEEVNALGRKISEQTTDAQLLAMDARRRQLLGIQPDGQTGSGGQP